MKIHFSILLKLLIVVFVLSYPASAFTTIEGGDTIVIDDVIEDDVYIVGNNIIIKGTINGDLIVAGGMVDIQGNVTQDLIVAAGDVTITGNVGDDVRVVAGTLTIDGYVQDDLISFTGETKLSNTGAIGGDFTSASGQLSLLGDIDGNITGSGSEVTLGGTVGGNVDMTTGQLVVLPDAYIAGNLKYRSPESADIPFGTVGKDTDFLQEKYDDEKNDSFSIFSWFIGYLALVLLGILGMAIWPKQIQNIVSKTPESPGTAFLTGLAIFVAAFILSFMLLITVIGIPVSLILMALIMLGLYAARIFTAIWLGKYLFTKIEKESKPWLDLVLGIFALLLVCEIPIIGALVYMAATCIPVGNMYSAARKQ
jgi:cytoskeletal protein CcmA (bactofilin family)